MPLNDNGPTGYIRTPVELDAAARALDRTLLITPSPQKRFLHITEFWGHTCRLPASWLSGYLLPLAPSFLELLRFSSLSNLPAPVWRDAYAFYRRISAQSWATAGLAMDELHTLAVEHTIRSHAYVSALRELHEFLVEWKLLEGALDAGEWSSVFGASATAFGVFKAYVGVLRNRYDAVPAEFTTVLEQWEEYRRRTDAVAVVLLEADGDDRYAAGRVMLMDILSQEGGQGENNINNLLGDQGYETVEQLKRAQTISEGLIAERFGKTPEHRRYHFSLHETSVALVGGSLGCAAAAGITAGITHYMNLPQRWTLPTTVACVGSLATDGTVEAGSWDLIEQKLRAAFCSPVEKIVIPAPHRESALLYLQQLQRDHPKRSLEVLGVSHVRDLETNAGVFAIHPRGGMERMRESLVRHGVAFLLLLIVILFGGGGYFAYRAYYDYPNLEQTMGLSVGSSSIVFNPKDSLVWCFRDGKTLVDNNVGFGDLEIGDGFTRHFEIWNMTPSNLNLRLSIEGPDSTDWYINSADDRLNIPSAENRSIAVMFAPMDAGSSKNAALVLRNPVTGEALYRLRFEGAAGSPLSAGYALRLDGRDDQIHFGQRSTAFDITASGTKEATFECWIRPNAPLKNAMILHNGQSGSQKPEIEDLFFGFVTPDTMYYRVGSAIGMFVLNGSQAAAVGRWMHLALAISIPRHRIAVYLNGEELENRQAYFLFDGPGTPFVTIGARNPGTTSDLHFRGDIDEIRLWHRFRTVEEVRQTMHRRLSGLTPDLAGYWDVDASVENTLFNANTQAHSGALLHRPVLVRSDLRLEPRGRDIFLLTRDRGDTAIALTSGRYLVAVRPVLPRYTDATFAFLFLQDAEPAIHFNYVLKESGWISIENNMLFTMQKKLAYDIEPGWHTGVCTVTADGKVAFYTDGQLKAESRTVASGRQDWHALFEGMMLGFRFDKEQQLASKYYDWYHPTLSHTRSYGSLHVWKRILSEKEIADLIDQERVTKKGLVASWRLEQLPDANNNYIDEINHRFLHVKQVYGWE